MARIPRGKHKHANLSNLWEHHKEIARRLLLGERQCDIARAMNITPAWLSVVTTSPAFIKYLDGLRARTELGITDIRKEITAGAVKAVKVLQNLLTSTNENVQLKAATDLLDRDGYKAATKIEQSTEVTVHLTGDRIQQIKQRREAMLAQSRLVQLN